MKTDKIHELYEKTRGDFNDNDIDTLLTMFHQDLGFEGMLYCEVCNDNKGHNFGDKNATVSTMITDAIKERGNQ